MESAKLTVVMMAGLPGAGKTTLANALERKLGWHLIDKDKYRIELLKQEIDFDTASKMAYDRSFDEIRTMLTEHHTSIIFDTAALEHFVFDSVQDIITQCLKDVQLKVVLCVVDRDTRHDRLLARTFQYTRITIEPERIVDYLGYFEHLPDDKLVLYTDEAFDACLLEVIEYLSR